MEPPGLCARKRAKSSMGRTTMEDLLKELKWNGHACRSPKSAPGLAQARQPGNALKRSVPCQTRSENFHAVYSREHDNPVNTTGCTSTMIKQDANCERTSLHKSKQERS